MCPKKRTAFRKGKAFADARLKRCQASVWRRRTPHEGLLKATGQHIMLPIQTHSLYLPRATPRNTAAASCGRGFVGSNGPTNLGIPWFLARAVVFATRRTLRQLVSDR